MDVPKHTMAAIAYTSNERTHTDRYAAILVSAHAILGNDHWLPPLALLGSYPSWTLYFNNRGLKIEYFLSATYDDFKHVLLDYKYQSVVLVGSFISHNYVSYNVFKFLPGIFQNSTKFFPLSIDLVYYEYIYGLRYV